MTPRAVEHRPGDVLVSLTGRRRFVRIGQSEWASDYQVRVYVQDCDGAGFLLDGKGRWLLKSTLASRYRLHYAADEAVR